MIISNVVIIFYNIINLIKRAISHIILKLFRNIGGLCALGGVFILTLPLPIVVDSFSAYYKNRLWRNEVAHKKTQRATQKREMDVLMKDGIQKF